MRTPTSNEKVLLGLLVAILFVAGNWYGYTWYAGRQAALRSTANQLQSEQESAETALKEIPQWQARKAWLKDKQPPLGDEGTSKAAVLEYVQKGARAHKLEILEQSLNDVERSAGMARVNVSVKVKGGMHDLVDWLAGLQKPDDFYAVTLFSLKADQDQKSFDCTIQIARFFKLGGSS